jgi:N utilization substance protein A
VAANDTNVDPVGACVGARGSRVRMVVNELRGEKVDIVPYSPDPAEFVMKALSPAKVKEVRIVHETGTAEVVVPDYQLSVAIGKEGQNARLAARLTGWRVDIKSESQLYEEEQNQAAEEEEWAAGEWITDESGEMVWQPAEGGEAVSASEAGWGDVETAAEGEAEEKPDENIAIPGDTPEAPGEETPESPGSEAAEIVADAPTEVAAAVAEAPAEAKVADGEEGDG